MNKKTVNSILIILLLLIWGNVIYKYFGNANKSVSIPVISKTEIKPNLNYNIERDTFKLVLNNRDPFKASKPLKNTKRAIAPTVKKTPIKKTNITWPKIAYFGFVKGKQNSTKLALIKINNKLYRKREREKTASITIKKVYSDSISLTFNNDTKIFKRNK